MKFKTRLSITFLTIVFLPLFLTFLAFVGIWMFMASKEADYGIENTYSIVSEPLESLGKTTEATYDTLFEDLKDRPGRVEDVSYLEEINASIEKKASYLIVRKGENIYYAGNREAANQIFYRLPPCGAIEPEKKAGIYFNDLKKFVWQIDFTFLDGSEGSIFIITRIASIISHKLLADMFFAITLILIFTSVMLTQWIQKGVFDPVNELNIAMKKIKNGNFDYRLQTDSEGEIGELYHNYEDMRLRLKESADEKLLHEKQNKELISNISHDLKTPITAIKGYMEGIMDGVADTPEKMDKYIKTVYNKANDMDRLINELTIYSKFDNNKIPYNFHRINVADYFGDCVEEVGLDLEAKNIRLNYVNLVSPDTQIIADLEQMKRVINNIISNSVKYMDKKEGVIDIRILDEVDSVRVEIEDNGKGIAAKDLPNIFERFYRTDASRNSSQGGSGIGLSIVKKIIEDHGGYIWATSKEGEGTCMHFVIRKYREVEKSDTSEEQIQK